jgi:hypothetical protein
MSNLNHHYRSDDFSPEQTSGYTLLVQLGENTFSYAVTGQNKLLVLEGEVSYELSEPMDELLSSQFKERIIGVPNNGFTFIPAQLYNSDKAADFSRFLDVKSTDKVFSQPLDNANQVIYKADESIVATIADKFDVKDAVFSGKGWIVAIAGNNPSDLDLYLNIKNEKVEVLNFQDGKLRFYNDFEFQNEDELVYFTSFVVEALQLPPLAVTLILSGDVSLDDLNGSRLAEFFNKVELNSLKTTDLPGQFEPHSLLSLTALQLCGSSEAH